MQEAEKPTDTTSAVPESVPARPNYARLLRRGLYVLAALYSLLLVFPEPAFPYHRTRGPITLYATRPLPPQTDAVLDRAARLISDCPINAPGFPHRIFLCDGFARFAFFAPLHNQAVSTNSPLRDNIFLVDADLAADRVRRDPTWQSACSGPGNVARTVSGTIAHEVTHTLSRHRRGLVRSLLTPNLAWKEEGYCDWVARDSSFDPTVPGADTDSPCYRYFTYRQKVTRLIEQEGYTYDRLMDEK